MSDLTDVTWNDFSRCTTLPELQAINALDS